MAFQCCLALIPHRKQNAQFVLCLFTQSVSQSSVGRASLEEMATNYRFGSSCGPQTTASSGRELEDEKEVEEFGKSLKLYVSSNHLDVGCTLKVTSLLFSLWIVFLLPQDDVGNADPEKLLQCPYDKSHQIRACRFPYHLIKCGKVETSPFSHASIICRLV